MPNEEEVLAPITIVDKKYSVHDEIMFCQVHLSNGLTVDGLYALDKPDDYKREEAEEKSYEDACKKSIEFFGIALEDLKVS